MLQFFKDFYLSIINAGIFLQSFILLAIRLFWGWEFFTSGRDKLLNITPIIKYFQSLGIPFPTVNAYIVGSIECFCGLCLMIGLGSRLLAIPLMIVMIVALITAHHDAFINIFNDPQEFVSQGAFMFFFISLIVFAFGPGIFSLDALIKRIFLRSK